MGTSDHPFETFELPETKEVGLPNPREQEVLAAVLKLMVEEGDAFSMASVASRASCSKETLYRWYGDRDGLLTATVKWQASKVVLPEFPSGAFAVEQYREVLVAFAKSWLSVIIGEISVALNRMAITHAGSAKSNLGRIVLENGPLEMKRRLKPLFVDAAQAGHCAILADDAFRLFFGLVVADSQIRALLGDGTLPNQTEIDALAGHAVEQFMALSDRSTLRKPT